MKKKQLIAMPLLTALISVGLLNLQPAVIEAHTNYAQKPAQVRGERKSKVRKNNAKAKITRKN